MELFEFSKYIAAVYRQSKNDAKEELKELDLGSTQSDLMMFIFDHPGLTQKQLAAHMTLDASLLAKDIKVLMVKGLVERQVNPRDGRAWVISVTPAGEAMAQKLQQTLSRWWGDLFQQNPEIDSHLFGQQLKLVRQVLEERQIE